MFALSFDSLDLDSDDKNDMMASDPNIDADYKDTFLEKTHYPALEIAYLAVDERYERRGIGTVIVEAIVRKAQEQKFAGCQFLTVEALKTKEYSAIGFWSKCGFTSCEPLESIRPVCRMYRALFPKK